MNKILVIDNEFEIVEMISDILSIHDYEVKTALDGKDAIKSAIQFHPDLILCDISMPETNGYAVLKALRNDKRTHAIPFIFLTALGGMHNLRKGMRLGADDYLAKPFEIEELLARLRAIIRRSAGRAAPVLSIGPITLDPRQMRVTINGVPKNMSPQEYRLLSYLMLHAGRVISQMELT
ncbi:MAG: response regulator transcription factor [Anaerolineales bacterium]|nr:response regulator transcription factor [Anaerolineales bacterium]